MMTENNRGFTSSQNQSERDVIERNARSGSGIRESAATSTGDTGTPGEPGMRGTSAAGPSKPTGNSSATAQDVKQQAKDMANQTKEQGKSMLEEKKGVAASQVDSMAHAFRTTAEHLQGEGQNKTGDYVGMVADQLETAARQLKEKNFDELINDAQNLARRSPATFIAGSVAVGFLLARFLKSSSDSGGRNSGRSSGRSSDKYGGTERSAFRDQNRGRSDGAGVISGADDYYRTEPAGYSEMSSLGASGGSDYESADLSRDRDRGRDAAGSAGSSAVPLSGAADTGYPPAGTNAADIAGTRESAINPPNPSTLGGNSYGNR